VADQSGLGFLGAAVLIFIARKIIQTIRRRR
jgi:hypothetical protein